MSMPALRAAPGPPSGRVSPMHPGHRYPLRELGEDLHRPVLGGVIHKDDLHLREGDALVEKRLQRVLEISLAVADGNDDGYERFHTGLPSAHGTGPPTDRAAGAPRGVPRQTPGRQSHRR
jgi:hypothetical protein